MIMDLEQLLYEKVRSEIEKWDSEGVYALYFGVSVNSIDGNIPHFVIGRGVDRGKPFPDKWHLAVSAEDETEITADNETAQALTAWLHAQGVADIGYEDPDEMYDEMMSYIGKGPAGSYELLQLGVKIAKRLFEENFIREKFDRDIPVIFDDLETTWYNLEATENANPDGLADEFLRKFSANRKNSPEALRFAKAAMGFSGMFRIGAFLPMTIAAALFTLVFGGIRFPLAGGGVVKAAAMGIICVLLLLSRIRQLRAYVDGAKPFLRLLAVTAADICLAAVCLFSCNFMADRLAAGAFFIVCALICAADYAAMRKGMKKLVSERGSEISKTFVRLRKNNDISENNNNDLE